MTILCPGRFPEDKNYMLKLALYTTVLRVLLTIAWPAVMSKDISDSEEIAMPRF